MSSSVVKLSFPWLLTPLILEVVLMRLLVLVTLKNFLLFLFGLCLFNWSLFFQKVLSIFSSIMVMGDQPGSSSASTDSVRQAKEVWSYPWNKQVGSSHSISLQVILFSINMVIPVKKSKQLSVSIEYKKAKALIHSLRHL